MSYPCTLLPISFENTTSKTSWRAALSLKPNQQIADVAAETVHVPRQRLKAGLRNHPSGVDRRLLHYGLKSLGQTDGTQAEVQRVVDSPEEDEVRVVEDDHLLLFSLTQPAKQWNRDVLHRREEPTRFTREPVVFSFLLHGNSLPQSPHCLVFQPLQDKDVYLGIMHVESRYKVQVFALVIPKIQDVV